MDPNSERAPSLRKYYTKPRQPRSYCSTKLTPSRMSVKVSDNKKANSSVWTHTYITYFTENYKRRSEVAAMGILIIVPVLFSVLFARVLLGPPLPPAQTQVQARSETENLQDFTPSNLALPRAESDEKKATLTLDPREKAIHDDTPTSIPELTLHKKKDRREQSEQQRRDQLQKRDGFPRAVTIAIIMVLAFVGAGIVGFIALKW